jgi:hypothetical protein
MALVPLAGRGLIEKPSDEWVEKHMPKPKDESDAIPKQFHIELVDQDASYKERHTPPIVSTLSFLSSSRPYG